MRYAAHALGPLMLAGVCLCAPVLGQQLPPATDPGPAPSVPIPDTPPPAARVLDLPDTDTFGRGGRGGAFGNEFSDPLLRIGGPTGILGSYRTAWLPTQNITGTAMLFGAVREELSLSLPAWRDGTDRFSISLHVRDTLIQTDALLPKSGLPFPRTLWDIGMGFNFQHRFENGWTGGLGMSIGSASDDPFERLDEIRVGFNGFLRIPRGDHGAWNLSLSYAPFGELAFPIPGVAYIWQPSEFFRASIGVPFQIMWRPTPDLTIDASYMPLTNVRGRIAYRIAERVTAYVEYTRSAEGYYLADQVEVGDRLLYRDSRVVGGVQARLWGRAMLEVFSGYVFTRSISEGRQIGGLGADALFIDPGPVLGGRLQVRW